MKTVHKRLETEVAMKYADEDEEATEMRSQQECILSGGVYLRHRLKDNLLPFLLPKYSTITQRHARLAFRRAGVQETVPRFDLTR
jgi:hypothetical protein